MVQIRLATEEDKDVISGFQLRMALETEDLKLDNFNTINAMVEFVERKLKQPG